MKAERRHELQENSLARFMNNLPVMLRLYADRVLLGLVLVLLVIVLINWRSNSNRRRLESAETSLATARTAIRQLESQPMQLMNEQRRGELRGLAERSINDAVENGSTDDPKFRAQALLTRADLLWTLANLPETSAAATQPLTTQPVDSSKDDLLKQAEAIYQQVHDSSGTPADARLDATFGLAAIDEDRGNLDSANQRYQSVLAMKDLPKRYHDLANIRIRALDQIRQPLLIGQLANKPPELPTTRSFAIPTSLPAATQPK